MAETDQEPLDGDVQAEEAGDAADEALPTDESGVFSDAFITGLVEDLNARDEEAVRARADELHVADLADLLALLSGRQRRRLLAYLGDSIEPELFHEVEGVAQDDLYDVATTEQIVDAVTELETDDAVYILEDLKEDDRAEVLEALSLSDRRALEESLSYPEDSAGRLMQRDLVALPEFWSVGQTIDHLREAAENLPEDFYDLFGVDPTYKLAGVVSLSTVMRSPRTALLKDLMGDEVRKIKVLDDQEDVAYRFNKYHLISAPVVDDSDRLVGVITVDDVIEVIEEEAEEDILALAGVTETSVHENFRETLKGRLWWLTVNLATAVLTSLVIGAFDATLEEKVALAVLMPIIASMGGNAGTQTMTVAVRAIATKELDRRNMWRVLRREVTMAGINGLVLAALSGLLVLVWFGEALLAGVFMAGMVINLLVAGLSGLTIPLALQRADIDPAVASSVFVTTITDVVGFFAFLALAAIVLL